MRNETFYWDGLTFVNFRQNCFRYRYGYRYGGQVTNLGETLFRKALE